MLECIYIFAWVIWIASQVLFDLSWRRAYGPGLVQILQFQLGDILILASVEGVLPGAHLDTRREHQAPREPWKVSLHGSLMGGFLLLVVCASHHLPSRLTFRVYDNPVLKTELLHIS